METRIRHFRKLRGWTLQELAERIGTTAQTIQRLETSNMTVSTDWLERIGAALGVPPINLLSDTEGHEIALLGALGRDGILRDRGDTDGETIALDVPAERPVAVRLADSVGAYPAGALLIGNKLEGTAMLGALGKDALVQISSGPLVLRRVVRGGDNTFTLVPLEPGGDVRYDETVDWIARLVMRIDYL